MYGDSGIQVLHQEVATNVCRGRKEVVCQARLGPVCGLALPESQTRFLLDLNYAVGYERPLLSKYVRSMEKRPALPMMCVRDKGLLPCAPLFPGPYDTNGTRLVYAQ